MTDCQSHFFTSNIFSVLDPAIDKYLLLCKRELQKEERMMKEKYKGMFDKLLSGDEKT